MSDYNKYIVAINKIFECLEKMKSGWKNQDNYNYIDCRIIKKSCT